jgi:hypothetical protein
MVDGDSKRPPTAIRRLRSQETVVMGSIWKAASIIMLAGLSNHAGSEPRGKAARDRARAAGDQAKAAQAQAELAEAETKLAKEQATAIAKAMQEDEAHRQADLEQVAEEEAEAVPWPRPADS